MNAARQLKLMGRTIAVVALALVGFAQVAGDIFHSSAVKAVAAATAASPAPKVFSTVKGLETFSTRFFIEWNDATGAGHSVEITPERYAQLRGPYNRRNVYGAVLAYTEIIEIDKSDVLVANLWFGTAVYPLLEPPARLSYTFQLNFPHI